MLWSQRPDRCPAIVKTLASVCLITTAVALILSAPGCLRVPVGDPSNSKMDPALVGIWHQAPGGGEASGSVFIVHPFDERTYVVQWLPYKLQGGQVEVDRAYLLKGWRVPIGDALFFATKVLSTSEPGGTSTVFPLYRIDSATADRVTMRMIKPAGPLEDVKDSQEALTILKANLANEAIYHTTMSLQKASTDDTRVKAVMSAYHLPTDRN